MVMATQITRTAGLARPTLENHRGTSLGISATSLGLWRPCLLNHQSQTKGHGSIFFARKKEPADSWCSDLHLHCRSHHLSPAPVHKDILRAVVSMPILTAVSTHGAEMERVFGLQPLAHSWPSTAASCQHSQKQFQWWLYAGFSISAANGEGTGCMCTMVYAPVDKSDIHSIHQESDWLG